ncbi:MAG: aspartate kinase [Acidobacteriota bacterium]
MTRILVQKYGGTSVASAERILNVAGRIARTQQQGCQVVAVVSAMGQATDELLHLSRQVNPHPSRRELDMLLSTGEQVSIALLAMALEREGVPAVSLTGLQSGIVTDMQFSNARIQQIDTKRLRERLRRGQVAIVAGFQGVGPDLEITTLGRGGSDTTAAALAAALKAEACEIYTDVDGVYTSDPRLVPEAARLECISYGEMLELAGGGAQVLHPRCVEICRKYAIPLWVRSSFGDRPGTLVWRGKNLEQVVITGATLHRGIAKVAICGVPDRPGIAARVFDLLSKEGINVRLIIQSISHEHINDISLVVEKSYLSRAVEILELLKKKIGARELVHDSDVAELSIVGSGIASTSGVAAQMFKTLAREKINIQLISTSEVRIACIIDAARSEQALRAVHREFHLEGLRRKTLKAGVRGQGSGVRRAGVRGRGPGVRG